MLKLIKSSSFLKIIVENLDVKKKLKFFMVNKSLLKRLNIPIKDFAKIYSDKLIIKHDSSTGSKTPIFTVAAIVVADASMPMARAALIITEKILFFIVKTS